MDALSPLPRGPHQPALAAETLAELRYLAANLTGLSREIGGIAHAVGLLPLQRTGLQRLAEALSGAGVTLGTQANNIRSYLGALPAPAAAAPADPARFWPAAAAEGIDHA